MPPDASRQQRRLERQRGAGQPPSKRQVKDTSGFDLVIPSQDDAPLEPRQSSRSEKLPPPRSTRRTPVPANAPILQSSPRTGAAPVLPPLQSGKRPASTVLTGKRKRPTGEATFDVPGSPPVDTAADEFGGEPIGKSQLNAEAGGSAGDPDAEQGAGSSNILRSMEVNGSAPQKVGVKKRKKRKSIGQQATKRVKAKVSPTQKHAVAEVKPESMSPSAPPEGSSRLDMFPAAIEDPAKAQIQYELAGAAEQGMRDSLVGDTGDEGSEEGVPRNRNRHRPQGRKDARMRRTKDDLHGRDLAIDPHLYSLPTSLPTTEPQEDPEDRDEDGEEEQEGVGERETDYEDDDPQEEEEDDTDEYHDIKTTPSADRKAPPPKPKRKKRKSIGQQRPKRPSTGLRPVKSPSTNPDPKPRKPSRLPSSKPTTATTTINPSRPLPANAIPITIYRPAPPSSPSSNTSDPDPDPLTAPLPPAPTSTLTPIDVLSQVTRELIQKTAAHPSLSARAQRTITLYGHELEARMKQLGQALATNSGLGKRLREVNQEGRRVKEELEGVEGEMGVVREKVEEVRGLERRVRLGALMGAVERVMRRGWEWERGREGKGP